MQRVGLALVAVLGLALAAAAQEVVSRDQAKHSNQRLYNQVVWHRSLDEALAEAKAQNKPVLWVHLLGDLEGST